MRTYRTKEPRNVCVHEGTAERGSLSNQLNAEPTRWSLAILATLQLEKLKPRHWDLLLVGVGVGGVYRTMCSQIPKHSPFFWSASVHQSLARSPDANAYSGSRAWQTVGMTLAAVEMGSGRPRDGNEAKQHASDTRGFGSCCWIRTLN